MSRRDIRLRHCTSVEEMQACVALQQEVWQFSDADLVPVRLFVVAEKIGGQVIGALDGDQLIGFVMSIPGSRGGRPYLHSHMLAVLEGYRDRGVGRSLKLAQRQDALRRGFELIEWTFDPLEIKNAYLNLEKLGAIARRYNLNQYGFSSSPLQGGLPTDRLVAEWWLRSRRVEMVLGTGVRPDFTPEATIDLPGEVYKWKASPENRDKASAVQSRNRDVLQKAFANGLVALGFERDAGGNGRFLLGRWDESWTLVSDF